MPRHYGTPHRPGSGVGGVRRAFIGFITGHRLRIRATLHGGVYVLHSLACRVPVRILGGVALAWVAIVRYDRHRATGLGVVAYPSPVAPGLAIRLAGRPLRHCGCSSMFAGLRPGCVCVCLVLPVCRAGS